MKKLILSLFLLMVAVSVKAQTDYFPNNHGTIARSGYTYKFEMEGGYLTIYNIENRFTGVYEAMKDGSPMSRSNERTPPIEEDGWTKRTAKSIVQGAMNTLPALEKSLVAGKKLSIYMKIDTSTGKVCDVIFKLFDDGPFRYVPIEIYRKIETDLKEQLLFTVNDFGRQLNFATAMWFQTIKFDAAPTPPTNPGGSGTKEPDGGDPKGEGGQQPGGPITGEEPISGPQSAKVPASKTVSQSASTPKSPTTPQSKTVPESK